MCSLSVYPVGLGVACVSVLGLPPLAMLVVLQRKLVSTGALGLGLAMRPQHCEKSCARVAAIRGRWHGQKKAAR